MSFMSTPADATHSTAASVNRSSALLSHSSPKGVHPMPTIATRSRIPLLAMSAVLLLLRAGFRAPLVVEHGPGLPEVIMHALCRIEAPEGHLHPGTDGQGGRIDV